MTEFDCTEVTLSGWRNVKIQLLTNCVSIVFKWCLPSVNQLHRVHTRLGRQAAALRREPCPAIFLGSRGSRRGRLPGCREQWNTAAGWRQPSSAAPGSGGGFSAGDLSPGNRLYALWHRCIICIFNNKNKGVNYAQKSTAHKQQQRPELLMPLQYLSLVTRVNTRYMNSTRRTSSINLGPSLFQTVTHLQVI